MADKFYVNQRTEEITDNHRTAVEWYRNGDTVAIQRNGRTVLVWEF